MLSDVDAATLEILHEGPQFSADAYTEQVVANANGEMVGILLDINYESMAFFASEEGGFTSLQESIVGEAPIDHLSVIDMNDAGQIAIQFSSNSYGACAILAPAGTGGNPGAPSSALSAVGVTQLARSFETHGREIACTTYDDDL